ncbi:aminotransferase class V-fold PLP-dependent enzyme [Streptomyces sp. NPDC096324]|uniref:aminotransferase class V-fold PLP-dependent enzyme n=1 Tax=Streptomyces sp. NPDC096324 TaxID=3366085 RepID=UPI0038226D42
MGLPQIGAYEHTLVEHATEGLRGVPGLRLVGTAAHKASIVSFVLDGYEPAEVGAALNEEGIAVRSGHHCAQPAPVRPGGHRPAVVRLLQHARGGGHAGRGGPPARGPPRRPPLGPGRQKLSDRP